MQTKTTPTSPHRPARFRFKPQHEVGQTLWKPQPCGLSREELRRLVAEMVG